VYEKDDSATDLPGGGREGDERGFIVSDLTPPFEGENADVIKVR
jgi:hypothetical protein